MSTQITVTLGFEALSLIVSGAFLVLRRVVAAGILLGLAGVLCLVAAALRLAGAEDAGTLAAQMAGIGVLPLALTAYPTLRWRHPVDVAALIVLSMAIPAVIASPAAADLIGYLAFLTLVVHVWWRIETCSGRQRMALLWMATTVVTITLVIGLVSFAVDGANASPALSFLLVGVLGPVLVLGVSQPDVVDVRGLVVRIAVFVSALLVHVSVFVVLVGFLDVLGVSSPSIGTLALLGALSAAAFHPVQVAMRGVMDEILFGRRPDPLGAATTLAGRVGSDVTDTLDSIRDTLVLPYAALLVEGEPVAESGAEPTHVRRLDLAGAGTLVVGLRAGDLSLSAGDQHVLGLVVPLLVQNLRARALATQLQESREQTITVVEEERRRLRRDLHDGLGPRLSGIAFSTDAVRNLLRTDPDQADELLVTLRRDTATAIDDIRRLVYAMRPPALDELGLVPALRQQTLTLRRPSGGPLAVSVSAPEQLGDLPAAVEVAAYRIVMEALTNVARHSAARHASVVLVLREAGLTVEVQDAGDPGPTWTPGVGMSSMRERAVELGGTFSAGPGPSGGRVCALLPLSRGDEVENIAIIG